MNSVAGVPCLYPQHVPLPLDMSCEETKQQAEPCSYPLFPGEDQLQALVCTKAELGVL